MSDDAPTVEAAREQLIDSIRIVLALAHLDVPDALESRVDALIAAVRSDALRGSADPRTAKQVEVHHEAQVAHMVGAVSQPPLPLPAPPSTPRQEPQ